MARKVRISVSVFFGVLTVALCVLWVRSYSRGIYLSWNGNGSTVPTCVSVAGELRFQHREIWGRYRGPQWASGPAHLEHEKLTLQLGPLYYWSSHQRRDWLFAPHWALVAVSSTIGFLPWLPWSGRFSLRTLLIATTLVAAVLGLVVWASR
jgi:hypothetical protein